MLRMHDHLKYPYFVAFYENRVKVGLRRKVYSRYANTGQWSLCASDRHEIEKLIDSKLMPRPFRGRGIIAL